MKKHTILLAILILGLTLFAQDTNSVQIQEQKTQELKHDVTVTLKLVQVYVTDPAGNPALDLEKSDFVIYDNGKLQIITDFEKHILTPPIAKEEKVDVTETAPSRDVPPQLNRKFIFLIDYERNDLEGIAKSRTSILQFIDTKTQPGDEIALFSYSFMRGLTLHEYFTSDHKRIRASIEKIRELPGITEGWNSWRALGYSVMGMESLSPRSSGMKGTLYFSSRIQELAKALRYIPGPKNVILFSRGDGLDVLMPKSLIGEAFQAMSKELASANCPVFSINTISGIGKIKVLPEDSLDYLSKFTGGKYFHDVNYESRIADDIQSVTSTYYVLGYTIGATWDGRFRDIKVEVKRAGYKVYAQKGYFNPKHFSEYTKVEKELHLIDLALSESPLFQTPVNIPMTALPYPVENEPGICLLAQLPGEKIREKIGEEAGIFFLVFDRKNNILELKLEELEPAAFEEKNVYYYSLFPFSTDAYKCSIVIRDKETGESAVGRNVVEIPEMLNERLQLWPPLLLTHGKADLYVRGHIPKLISSAFPLLEYFPFDTELYSPILGELPKNTQEIQAVLHCSMGNLTEPVLKFEVTLMENSSGQTKSLPVSILSSKKEGKEGTFLAEFKLPELMPGEYGLRITTIDILSQARSQTTIALNVY